MLLAVAYGNMTVMDLDSIFNRLWVDYKERNPSVQKIVDLFDREGEVIRNDHIAFRTLDHPAVNIDAIARPFARLGYVAKGEYIFKDKHLFARHFEIPGNPRAPRVFISQLILAEFSESLQRLFKENLDNHLPEKFDSDRLIFSGSLFNPLSYKVYNELRPQSEYAAWFYVFGFRANHFTVSVNSLKKYNTILKVNQLLKDNGFLLNSAGGEVKGNVTDHLQQSSTMADIIPIQFEEGTYSVPSCYYEFAQRFPLPNGELFSGFVAQSADKIFESTDYYKKNQ